MFCVATQHRSVPHVAATFAAPSPPRYIFFKATLLLLCLLADFTASVSQRFRVAPEAWARAATTPSSCSCFVVTLMEPSSLRRAPARHGHRSSMSSCTSASSRHTRKSAAGHSLSRHPAHAGEGWRLVRWRYCLDRLVAGPQLMNIDHRLSVLAGERPWHPVPPPDPFEERARPYPAPGPGGGAG